MNKTAQIQGSTAVGTVGDGVCDNPPVITFAVDNSAPYTPPASTAGTLDYSTSDCSQKESAYIASLMQEALNAAAGPVNVFPLLGVYDQGTTIDQTGSGYPLSSGTAGGYNVLDGFNVNNQSWQSIQTGADVIKTPSYIGYDFGTKKAWGGTQERYQPAEPIRKKISTLKIKQGANSANRATLIRVEASDNGVDWKRIDVVSVPNTPNLETVGINSYAAFNKWRFIPSFFNGVGANVSWEIVQLQLLESTQVSLDNIEDYVLLENRDRSYLRTSTLLKCQYDLLDVQTELAKFGINLPQTYIFTCSFASMVTALGRPVLIGDIVELPGEVQYDHRLRPVRKWLEVTDTGWSTEGYTMNWKPQLFRFYAQPILPSVEHKDILGLPGRVNSLQKDSDVLNGFLVDDQAYEASTAIQQAAAEAVPQTGSDPQDIQSGMPLIGKPGGYDGRDLYVEDAIPPNGAPYTIGDALPAAGDITDGHYHRQTYTNVSSDIRPPDRLLQWNATTGRWKVIEVNTRMAPESNKKTIAQIMSSTNKIAPDHKP